MTWTQRLPLLLLAIAVVCTFGFDVFEFAHTYQQTSDGASWMLLLSSLAESTVDILVLLAVYWIMRGHLRKLQEVSDSKSEILSIVSHDLRSPISVMMGMGQILEESHLTDDQRRLVGRILANGEQTLDLINNLLSQSAFDEKALKIKARKIGVTDVVKDVLESHRPFANRKNIQLQLQANENFTANLDSQKFRQMLDNLISNAIKYSPPGSSVSLSLKRQERSFAFDVHDKGPGLSESEIEEVFHRFSPVKNKPTGGEYSTGIGLSIARQLAELHGGTLSAESAGHGHGSTFHLQLPL